MSMLGLLSMYENWHREETGALSGETQGQWRTTVARFSRSLMCL
jgi:hypothetical protein